MKTKFYLKFFSIFFMLLLFAANAFSQPVPTITGPEDPTSLMPATLGGGITVDQVYITESGMTNYVWAVSAAGAITAPADPTVSNSITVTWTNPTGQQTVSVNYTDPVTGLTAVVPTVLIINYYPFLPPIDPETIPKYVDPLPHFAAGLRVDAKAGGNLTIKAVPVQQVALSTGTPVDNGIIGTDPGAGLGNYAAYAISNDGGATFGPAMWPAQTIEAQQGNQLTVNYLNELVNVKYSDFNILADQTLMMKGYTLNGNPLTDPYEGPIPMVVHLHGGEMPSGSDGGPNSWFMPTGTTGVNTQGPGFQYNASTLCIYPNQQEATTLWYHPHDDGLTSRNVYIGMAGYYFLRGADEETAKLPGWSGDSKVKEITPVGKSATFNGANTYLPEIEIAIQDRMFNTKGELYWPVDPVNPDIHPFWTPEFIGDVMTVNGKSWPYLSVAPRKYRFRILEGCNARFLNMWLVNAEDGSSGPAITVIGGEGGLLETPVTLDPAAGGTLLMSPGQRYDVIVDFTGLLGNTYTLMNDANSPYPFGDPVEEGMTDQIMQFVVNGDMVSADNSQLPVDLRSVTPLVKLTDFKGNLSPGVTPVIKRQLILNEISAAGGPASALVNNAYFEGSLAIPGTPIVFGGPTEIPLEGTTEIYQIINISADAHPIHIHLLQWQLVSRQAIDDVAYMGAYQAAWAGQPEFPVGLGYPGGAGSPYPYNTVNTDGAVGGNPPVSGFLKGAPIAARPEEQGWKDNIIVMPGEVTTFVTRVAPTDRAIDATPAELMFPFDPSEGPGYVWHCHIVDHEDMSMMRPLPFAPSPLRYPQITAQPALVEACFNGIASFSVTATSETAIVYQWQISIDAGLTWSNLTDIAPYTGTLTSTLNISPVSIGLKNNLYRVLLTNFDGTTTSNPASMTVSTIPAKPGNFTVLTAIVYQGQSGVIYSVPMVVGAGVTYNWTYSGTGVTIKGNTNSVILDFTPTATSGILSVTASNFCGISAARTLSITVNGITPMPISFTKSSAMVCQTQSNVIYTVPLLANTTYTWFYSGTGATIKGTSNSVKIDFKAATTGILSVIATKKGWGPSAPLTMAITVDQNCILKSGTIPDAVTVTSEITFTEDNELKAYPNPTSGNINFEFRIKDNARVVLDISNVVGTHIDRIFDNDVNATEPYRVVFEKSISPGIYFYHLKWNDQTITGKFIKQGN